MLSRKVASGTLGLLALVILGVIAAAITVHSRRGRAMLSVPGQPTQMLWEDRAVRSSPGWINIDKPTENFNWNYDSSPACDGDCAFRDKVFTVDDWDKLCIQHCGNIDTMLAAVSLRQKHGAAAGAKAKGATNARTTVSAEDRRALLAAGAHLLAQVGLSTMPRRQSLEDAAPPAPDAAGKTVKWSGAPWDERAIPEQHSDVPVVLQDWDTFWDQGSTLKADGVNVDDAPIPELEVKHPEDRPRHDLDHLLPLQTAAGVRASGWPWDAEARPAGPPTDQGRLLGVHRDGWDGAAFSRMGPPPLPKPPPAAPEAAAPEAAPAA